VNKCHPFQSSHPLLSSPSLLLSPFSTFGHQRPSLAEARQLYAFIDNSIFSILHFANDFLIFLSHSFCTPGAARASTCSRHRPRRLEPLSRDGLCIRGQPPPSRGGHRVQLVVRSPFVSHLLCDSHLSPPCICALRPLRRLRPRYCGTAVHTPAVATATCSRFHPIPPLSFSLNDIPVSRPGHAEALVQFHPGTAPH
jgi:hypothetical protein